MLSEPSDNTRSTRRDILQTAMLLSAAAVAATVAPAAPATGQETATPRPDNSLYDRLGGSFAIGAVVD
jgi:hypothetical protein